MNTKKTYQQPTMMVVSIEQTNLCGGGSVASPGITNEVSSNDAYSRESGDWDD